jgi:hypothetical protein
MDENGVCKFPADKLGLIVDNLQILQTEEDKVRPQGAWAVGMDEGAIYIFPGGFPHVCPSFY